MSRRTSDFGDSLAIQDGYRDGKNTTWKANEPLMTLDFNDAASSIARYTSAGDKRYLDIVRNHGGRVARGSAGSYNGMVRGRDFGQEYGISPTMEGSNFASLVTKDLDGVIVWVPEMLSADAFQWNNRGANGGKIDDSNDGYLLAEDPRNKQYSIAMYTPKGRIPKDKVYPLYVDGYLEQDFSEEFFKDSPIWQVKSARDRADALKKQQEADKIRRASIPKPVTGSNTWELSVSADGLRAATAKSSAESMQSSMHSGVAVAGTDWETISEGKTPAEWGLPYALVAYQPDGSIRVAKGEYDSLRTAAQSDADNADYANEVLSSLGFGFDRPAQQSTLADFFGGLF